MNIMHNNPEFHRGPCDAPTTQQREKVRDLVRHTKAHINRERPAITHLWFEITYGYGVSSDGPMEVAKIDQESWYEGESCGTDRQLLHQMLDEFLDKGVITGEGHFTVRPSRDTPRRVIS